MEIKKQYDKLPATFIEDGLLIRGWENILKEIILKTNNNVICIECYSGIYYEEVMSRFQKIPHVLFIDSSK
ncbi:MAG: mannose-6-phosphate isomerase, partial [Desulfobulbus sp.]